MKAQMPEKYHYSLMLNLIVTVVAIQFLIGGIREDKMSGYCIVLALHALGVTQIWGVQHVFGGSIITQSYRSEGVKVYIFGKISALAFQKH